MTFNPAKFLGFGEIVQCTNCDLHYEIDLNELEALLNNEIDTPNKCKECRGYYDLVTEKYSHYFESLDQVFYPIFFLVVLSYIGNVLLVLIYVNYIGFKVVENDKIAFELNRNSLIGLNGISSTKIAKKHLISKMYSMISLTKGVTVRIHNSVLVFFSLFGGLGEVIALYIFQHKRSDVFSSFRIGIYIFTAIHIACTILIIFINNH